MTMDVPALIGQGGSTAILAAGLWFVRQAVENNRKRSDERHIENVERLDEIREDVKRINGSVARHDERLEAQGNEINRLRGRGQR